jgi:two-component system, NtrC family, sensor kinase
MLKRLRDVSLRGKITMSFMLIVLGGTSISILIGSRIITNAMLNEARKQVGQGLEAAGFIYSSRLESVRESIASAAEAQKVTSAAASRDATHLTQILQELRNQKNLDFLTFVDAGRGMIARASAASVRTYSQEQSAFSDILAAAMAGKITAGTEIIGRQALFQEDPALTEQVQLRITPRSAATPETEAEVDSGMVLVAAAPVSSTSGLSGVLYGGVLLNRRNDIVDRINQVAFGGSEFPERNLGTASIAMGDVRIETNLMLNHGERALGVRVSPEAAEVVLKKGSKYYGRAYVGDEWQLTAYEPIPDHQGRIIGMLSVEIPERPFLAVRTSMMLSFLLVAASGVLVVMGLTYLITRTMIHPLEDIVSASNRIAAGDLDFQVKVSSRDEIGHLADSFNKMVASIKTMKLELEEWGRTLEEKVNKRSDDLVAVQSRMAQSEKLASIGRLAAGVAHEINNPLGGILTFSMLALEDCDSDHPMKQPLEVIVKQTLRCREIVKGLLDFARQSDATNATITEVNSVVDKTLSLLKNQAIFHNIVIVPKLAPTLPNVIMDPGQLQQVVVNIVLNAVDAMEENGTLTVETSVAQTGREVVIRFSDTGKGIPDKVLPFIFEPFFTTKKVGKGTGLGLSIVHGIVGRAGGKVEVETSHKGTAFIIRLPIAAEGASSS